MLASMGLLKERGTLLTGEWQDNKKIDLRFHQIARGE